MDDPAALLGPHGPFAARVPGFAPRAAQQAMAQAVAAALDGGGVLVAEAGTGTGKTFAYLVPALLSGRKVILSTGTRNLQDQLFHRDLPQVAAALGTAVDAALLKGRANYVCLHRLERAQDEGRFRSRAEAERVVRIARWARTSDDGDIAGCPGIGEQDPVWPLVTANADNCLGQECGHWEACFLVRARRRAQAADLVVVNHHLLFADMALREEGFGEILPLADAFVIDEAHQLPETASAFFGLAVSSNQLVELAGDAEAEYLREVHEDRALPRAADALRDAARAFRAAFGEGSRRGGWAEAARRRPVAEAAAGLRGALDGLAGLLAPLAERTRGLERCHRRAQVLAERLDLLTGEPPEDAVHWFETHRRSVSLHLTPLDVAGPFREYMAAMPGAWIFTSATLAVGGDFSHFTRRLGIEAARCEAWDSPFDYARQSLLYLPRDMPDPNAPDYGRAVLDAAEPVLAASGGRAFLLYTSHRALNEAAEHLRGRLPWPVLVQGDAPRAALLDEFRAAGDAVLLGTASFWEGVDVRGEALSCVIIDKLPFASPGDPVLGARLDALRRGGGNPFMEYQLPAAVIALKQGAGRLIRDVADRGVLVICDPRLLTRPYGRVFLDSLPPMPQTRDLADVEAFFAADPARARAGGTA